MRSDVNAAIDLELPADAERAVIEPQSDVASSGGRLSATMELNPNAKSKGLAGAIKVRL